MNSSVPWLGSVLAILACAQGARAVVVDFNSAAELSAFNQNSGAALVWSNSAGVGGGGGVTPSGFVEATYAAQSFSLSQVASKINLSALFKTGQLGVIGPGNFETYGEVYLTPNPTGFPFDDAAAFVEISRNSSADYISGGPLPAGGGSFPGFSANFPVGTLQSNRWYKLGVEYEHLSGGQLNWNIRVDDYGTSGATSLGSIMSTNQVTADTLGLRFDPTLYAGFSAISGASRVTAVDQFTVTVPAAPTGNVVLGPTFDVSYQPGTLRSITEGETSLRIGGISGSTTTPERRPLIEFPLSNLPPGARISSAQLKFVTNTPSGTPRIAVSGYEGDGLAALSDGTAPGTLVALTGATTCCGTVAVLLFKNYVQALVDSDATHLGLRLQSADLPSYVGLTADEATSAAGPTLEIQFSPPAARGDYTGDGLAQADDYTVWRDHLGSQTNLSADGDDNQVIDAGDLTVWRQNFGPPPALNVVNGEFSSSTLSGWQTVVTPNADISPGFPRVESFDVDGDGSPSGAMRIQVGQLSFLSNEVAGGGLQQLVYLAGGNYEVSASIASANLDFTGNTAPGRFELWLAGQRVDVADMNGTLINAGQVLRDTLLGTAVNVAPGWYDLEVRYLRPGLNSREIYGYFDDVRITSGSPIAAAIPEAPTAGLAIVAALLVRYRRHRCRKAAGP